jgi:hypothetical protein
MESKISLLGERYDIINVCNTLFIKTDERDWDEVKKCFADKVLFDVTSMQGGEPREISPDEITAMWNEGLKDLAGIHHQVSNILLDIRNLEADFFCYGIAIQYLPNRSNINTRTFVGSYDLHLIKTYKGWKINKFRYNLKFIDGNKELK